MDFPVNNLSQAAQSAQEMATELRPIGTVTYHQRLDGYALFEDDVMFGFIDQRGSVFFRTSPRTAKRFDALGSTKHPEMPYWAVPNAARHDAELLCDLAYEAADIAHLAASFGVSDCDPVDTNVALIFSAVATATASAILRAA